MVRLLFFSVALILATSVHAQTTFGARNYPQDGYAIEVPTSWGEKVFPGSTTRQFIEKSGGAYCSVESYPIDPVRMPHWAGLSESQIRAVMMQPWSLNDWFQIYPSLASAANFQVFNSYPIEIAGQVPSTAIEFRFSVPQGFFYRVRANFAIAKGRGYSLWCVGIGRSEFDADDSFRRQLAVFQHVASRLRLM